MSTVQLIQQTVIEEVAEIDLDPEQQAQFDKIGSLQDRAAFLEALLDDPETTVNIKESQSRRAVTHVYDAESNSMKAAATQPYIDYLEKLKDDVTPTKDYVVRFAKIDVDNGGERSADTRHIEAKTYAEAIETLLRESFDTGEVIDWVYNHETEEAPGLIQIDDRVFDLTACGERPVTLVSGILESTINRTEESYSQTVSNSLTGEELESITITDEDYQKLSDDLNSGPSQR